MRGTFNVQIQDFPVTMVVGTYRNNDVLYGCIFLTKCHVISITTLKKRALHSLHNNTMQSGLKMCPLKSRLMVFTGQNPVRSKTVIDNITV